MNHKFIFGCIIFVLGWTNAQSQTYQYSYNGSGDRIMRECIAGGARKGHFNDTAPTPDSTKILPVAVYPNPSHGIVNVTLGCKSLEPDSKYSLYDLNGKLLKESTIKNFSFQIDLGGFSKGEYTLYIIVGNTTQKNKITYE